MNEHLKRLLVQYDATIGIVRPGLAPTRFDNPDTVNQRLQHLRWMIRILLGKETVEGVKPLDQWSDRKINRWLGFIQGQLQALGLVTITSLRQQTKDLYDE